MHHSLEALLPSVVTDGVGDQLPVQGLPWALSTLWVTVNIGKEALLRYRVNFVKSFQVTLKSEALFRLQAVSFVLYYELTEVDLKPCIDNSTIGIMRAS